MTPTEQNILRELIRAYGPTARRSKAIATESVDSLGDAYRWLRFIENEEDEVLAALYLNTKNRPLSVKIVHKGSVNQSLVCPRSVFREAVRLNATTVIVAHNHPSGDPTPSPEDHTCTDRLKEAGKLLGIDLLDHLVIGNKVGWSICLDREVVAPKRRSKK